MVFSSLPIYLDPPNWSQQQPNQQEEVSIQNPQISHPLQPPPPTIVAVGGGGYQTSIRPGSMADRARLAKIHQPDVTLKCPRCESMNTKFCYYNNYSLSQPRHFCKTCRRYWTRGGALRNVPVGGGCRRNKRSKGTSSARSKSPMKPDHRHGSSSASANSSSSGCTNSDLMGPLQTQAPTQLPFLPTLHHYSDASPLLSGGSALHFGPTPSSMVVRNGNNTSDAEFEIGSNNGGSMLSSHNGLVAQWRFPNNLQQVHHHQQFPTFLTNLEPQVGVFQFGNHGENNAEYVRDHGAGRLFRSSNNKASMDDSSVGGGGGIMGHQANTVKMEENNNHQGLNLSKNVLGNGSSGNDLFWSSGSGNAWSEVPTSFTSSTSHLL